VRRENYRSVKACKWYDPQTGRIDRCLLASSVTFGERAYDEVPSWASEIPSVLEGATPIDLAKIHGATRRAYVEFLRGER